jgi:uncharacterized protein (DUF488 family)
VGRARSWRGGVLTIGDSTRTLDGLVAMLRALDVSELADVRTIRRSRHNPLFNGDALRATLRSRGMRYVQLPDLGGLRGAREDSEDGLAPRDPSAVRRLHAC